MNKTIDLWKKGEKVIVFCHYIATSRALRQHISNAIRDEIAKIGARKLGVDKEESLSKLETIGKRFFQKDTLIRKACDNEIELMLEDYKELKTQKNVIIEIVRRFLRTPTFLVRYFPIGTARIVTAAASR